MNPPREISYDNVTAKLSRKIPVGEVELHDALPVPAREFYPPFNDVVKIDTRIAFSIQRYFGMQPLPASRVDELAELVEAELNEVGSNFIAHRPPEDAPTEPLIRRSLLLEVFEASQRENRCGDP
jgi:hypothetical protein